jgi:hypothetical protein
MASAPIGHENPKMLVFGVKNGFYCSPHHPLPSTKLPLPSTEDALASTNVPLPSAKTPPPSTHPPLLPAERALPSVCDWLPSTEAPLPPANLPQSSTHHRQTSARRALRQFFLSPEDYIAYRQNVRKDSKKFHCFLFFFGGLRRLPILNEQQKAAEKFF